MPSNFSRNSTAKVGLHFKFIAGISFSQLDNDVNDKMIFDLINHSYDLVFKSLTKKLQSEIENLEN